MRVDGKGTEWIIEGRPNVGHYGDGELYITNGAVVTQLGEIPDRLTLWDDNYFLWYSNKSLIEISGEGSTLTINNDIRADYDYDNLENGNKFTLRDGGTLNLNGPNLNQSSYFYLPYLVNSGGTMNSSGHLTVSRKLQLGSDDGVQAGDFNFAKGLGLSRAQLIVKKLKDQTTELPLTNCDGCSIEYDANEKMLIKDSERLALENVIINKGERG